MLIDKNLFLFLIFSFCMFQGGVSEQVLCWFGLQFSAVLLWDHSRCCTGHHRRL